MSPFREPSNIMEVAKNHMVIMSRCEKQVHRRRFHQHDKQEKVRNFCLAKSEICVSASHELETTIGHPALPKNFHRVFKKASVKAIKEKKKTTDAST